MLLLALAGQRRVVADIVLVAFFVIEGVASIMFALDHKRELSGRWGWMLASGIVDLVLARMIFAGLPSTAAWAIGLLVGINMVFGGAALIAMALHARKRRDPPVEAGIKLICRSARQPAVVIEHGLQQHLRAGGALLLGRDIPPRCG